MRFAINHRRHDGSLIWQYENPTALSWRYQEGTQGPSTISYSLALSDPGIALFANPGVNDPFAPKRTDWELVVDDATGVYPLMSGPIWNVNVPFSGDTVNVTGLDWLAGLYQPYLGFDYSLPIDQVVAMLAAGSFVVSWRDTLLETVVKAVLHNYHPAEEIVLHPWTTGSPGPSDGTCWAQHTDFSLWRTDGTTKLSALTQLAQMGSPLGFDFRVDPDKNLHMVGPRLVTPGKVMPIYSMQAPQIVDGDWTNNGPIATDTIAVMRGSVNTSRYKRAVIYQPSIDTYRRWTEFAEIDPRYDVAKSNQEQVDAAAESLAQQHRNPQKELSLAVKPEAVDPSDETAFVYNHTSKAIDVDWTHPSGFHRVDGNFWINAQEYEVGDSGDLSCKLSLDQIYPT